MTKEELLRPLAAIRTDEVVVTTMGMVRPWAKLSSNPLDFASADSAMGHAADLALGIAMAQPRRKVLCLNGDGSMLMSLGTLATVIEARVTNLVLFVVQNETYEITGNQALPAAGALGFAAVARGTGFRRVYAFTESVAYSRALPEIVGGIGPVFVSVQVGPGSEGPIARGESNPEDYLKPSLAASAHQLRQALRS